MSHAHQDTTPAGLVKILEGYEELVPNGGHGPMSLVIHDHAMDEMFLRSLLRDARDWTKRREPSETSRICLDAECGMLEFLLALPEDMRLGMGQWGPIHALPAFEQAAGGESNEGDEPAETPGTIDTLVHPDDVAETPDEKEEDLALD